MKNHVSQGATEFLERFRLRPTRAAKVSEISEATAASSIAPEERVNFHIGNPVQEKRLSSALLRAVLGLDIRNESITEDHIDALLDGLDWSQSEKPVLELFIQLVRKSAPYLPRGGFARTAPSPIATVIAEWLQKQQEPLSYDMGKTSGHREVILASGGIVESLRVFFHALSLFLVHTPARILLFRTALPPHVTSFNGLRFETLPVEEPAALHSIEEHMLRDQGQPAFVVLGEIPTEVTRRSLRHLSLSSPLFFIEINDAPNHLSLAREARLIDRVVRFMTPGILSPHLRELSIVFVAGNADYLSLLETFHFQLKGTPSASEVELLSYLLTQPLPPSSVGEGAEPLPAEPPLETPAAGIGAEAALTRRSLGVEHYLESVLEEQQVLVESTVTALQARVEAMIERAQTRRHMPAVDHFAGYGPHQIVHEMAGQIQNPAWTENLRNSCLSAFIKHHPEYDLQSSVVVSGSSRTALGLLGFHCGIREVIIPDLSWTYEHCFPSVTAIPLTPEFGLDKNAILAAVDGKLAADARWRDSGAVVLNNPHNATGRVFDIASVKELLRALLERGIRVIDDLSYQNVAPSRDLPDIPTLRQLADQLVTEGAIGSTQSARVVTVHSISKTDCLAGARLSVVELREQDLFHRFQTLIAVIRPNLGAILLMYLFYRNSVEVPRAYWRLRNHIFLDRMNALEEAMRNLPADRNPYAIRIVGPTGSMYPLMMIQKLPAGLSLDWVAAGLARQGIGMVPLSTFARTEKGFETGRNSFRLTLGGTDGADVLLKKTRRVLIDLNRLIAEEGANYRRAQFTVHRSLRVQDSSADAWSAVEHAISETARRLVRVDRSSLQDVLNDERTRRMLTAEYLPERLSVYRQRFIDRFCMARDLSEAARSDKGRRLAEVLEQEFYKDDLQRREKAFRERLFDRTVHPTQMYSIRAEAAFDACIQAIVRGTTPSRVQITAAAQATIGEFLGLNVAINSSDEADEILIDLDAHIAAEMFEDLQSGGARKTLLSFWGDWDGSNRPSGQGHTLVASVLLENVNRLSRLVSTLAACDAGAKVSPELLSAIDRLPARRRQFVALLKEITALTHQLEGRYRGILPFHTKPGKLRQVGMALHLARDPVTSLWYHNDRLERRMLDLRHRRREALEYYFALNKQLRKEMHRLIPSIQRNLANAALCRESAVYRDLLQRFVLTPRIHQNMVTAQDPFAIDTTVFNIHEINEIGARYGNPGMALALQVSMSTRPEALIELERKMHARREHVLRDHPDIDLPPVWLIPLFEDMKAVQGIPGYLGKMWEYALQSRRLSQETRDRFCEIIEELFIAGSDLSQHIGQAPGAQLYRQAKYELLGWLATRGLTRDVRLKMGSGEPMQRQGGYYSEFSGRPAFAPSPDADERFSHHLRESTRKSTLYATTPMMGVFSGGDLRTYQSAIAERVRHLPVEEFAQLLHHVAHAQRTHRQDLIRAGEELAESRLKNTSRGEQALERLTVRTKDKALTDFLDILTENFRQILYGRDEDVVGIHIISYFIARTTPPLRDRPTVRPGQGGRDEGNRILERIAETIPFSRYGSRLRAIAHNQAQTAVLGVNQLTTGLFRALDAFSRLDAIEGDAETFVADRILPHLPVYEILSSLRLYHDVDLRHLRTVERAFPAGNSAFLALREDLDAMGKYIPLFQQELLRRHGIDVTDFFREAQFIPELLPTLRPDLAVLMQPDLFNTDAARLQAVAGGSLEHRWLSAVGNLLDAPRHIREWREKAWLLLERPVYQRVEAFVELAVSLYSISSRKGGAEFSPAAHEMKLPSSLTNFFRTTRSDDEMRQFLAAAMEYLSVASEGMVEVPANIIRAMKEVERIATIEEQALTGEQQDRLRFCLLQIARLAGENG